MFKNYLTVALRNLVKHKGYSLINALGLAVGLACCILIVLWIQDELSYDRFHQQADRLYRVIDHEVYTNGEELTFSTNPAALGPHLKDNYADILEMARVRGVSNFVLQYGDDSYSENRVMFADPSFLQMFSFPLLQGSLDNALSAPHSLVLTQSAARKYFGEENPLGKTVRMNGQVDFQVSAVLQDVPSNSHFHFDFLAPFKTLEEFGYPVEGWGSYAYQTWVLLAESANPADVDRQITDVVKQQVENAIATLSLQPLVDIHLYSGDMWGRGSGDIHYVVTFALIAGLVLLLACVNFINLTTARSANRAREVGLRKVIGAGRREVITQFFGESILYTLIALLIALLLAELALPLFNSISGKELKIGSADNLSLFLILTGIAALTGIVSGSYPALYLAAFKPAQVLKGRLKLGTGGTALRKVLVTGQFVITIALMIAALVVNSQLRFLQNRKLGYDRENILCVKLPGDLKNRAEWLKNELARNQDVIASSAVSVNLAGAHRSTLLEEWEGRDSDDKFLLHLMSADAGLLDVLQLQMIEGRYFSPEFYSADTSEGIIVNQSAVRLMGMDEPVGKQVLGGRIVGVLPDFHFRSLHHKIEPLALYLGPNDFRYLMIKLRPGHLDQTISSLETTWKQIVLGFPFEYTFLDEELTDMYREDQRVESLLNSFTALALLVASLGLLGLSSYTAERRTKEIGVRKVLGATATGIVGLLTREFLLLVGIANLIAWPIAWYLTDLWLGNFAFRIDVGLEIFLLTGCLSLAVALLTVSFQALKAALTDPVKSLRYE